MTETLLEYMQRRLTEYREVSEELPKGWERVEGQMQQMFPNCLKYNPCCDTHWNPKLENVDKVDKEYLQLMLNSISLRVWDTEYIKNNKPPDGYENIQVSNIE